MTTKAERSTMYERIEQHGRGLLKVFPCSTERDPVRLCKRLRRIEATGGAFAVRCCNGPEWPSEDAQDEEGAAILNRARLLLCWSDDVPVFLNRDPRGYALKIRAEWVLEHAPWVHQDWGGYGILAPDLR